jgi:MYXO-CTERM domain-containing protein
MKLPHLALLALLAAALVPTARATLIGDTIDITHYFPNDSTIYENHPGVLVESGSGDAVTFFTVVDDGPAYTVNPEASAILVNFISNDFWATDFFNGLVILGIDDTIVGATVDTNLSGWTSDRFAFKPHAISANWESLSFTTDTYFNVQLTTVPTRVPDAAATLPLAALALGGLAVLRRRRIAVV